MTVIARLYDNAWYVTHASPTAREQLAADVTRLWMARETAVEDATRARSVSTVAPGRSALALSMGNVAQAEYERAKSRLAEAARCTDIVNGHAFEVHRETSPGGAMTVELSSCTLLRRVTLSVSERHAMWVGDFTDPHSPHVKAFRTSLCTDPWDAFHRACEWITTGRL